jgi:hypothetical protein
VSDQASNPPPDHPWAKYYRERDKSRPPITPLSRTGAGASESERPHSARAAASSSAARASAKELDVTAANPEAGDGASSPAFLSAAQREERELATRRRKGRTLLRTAAVAIAGLVAVHFLVLNTVVREPTPARLHQVAATLAPQILRLYSSQEQPLEVVDFHAEIAARRAADDLACLAEITLRLREPLFAPADSNGTELYRSHATAIALAEGEALRRGLYATGHAPVPPLLPKVLRTAHRAGETLTVKIPFHARRFGWTWTCQPPELDHRTTSRTLTGAVLAQQGNGPVLLLDSPQAQAGIRDLTRAAKDYLEQINRDLEAHPAQAPAPGP